MVVIDAVSESVRKEELRELLYADDLGILAETEGVLHRRVVERKETLERKGLKANATEVMVCTLGGRVEADISDKKKDRLKQVETFKYPGSMITAAKKKWELDGERSETSSGSWMGKEVRRRVGAGWGKK